MNTMKFSSIFTRDTLRIMLGFTGLGLGVLIYLLDRPSELVYFLPDRHPFFTGYMTSFGSLGQHLPTFLHPFSLSLITAGILACRSTLCVALIGLGWLAINLIFEIGQADTTSTWMMEYIPDWFDKIIVLENTANYLHYGTYDPKDVVSIAIGSLIAFLINLYFNREGCVHEHIVCH